MSPFQANHGQNPRIGFELRKKRKYEEAERFVERIRDMQTKAKAALQKV